MYTYDVLFCWLVRYCGRCIPNLLKQTSSCFQKVIQLNRFKHVVPVDKSCCGSLKILPHHHHTGFYRYAYRDDSRGSNIDLGQAYSIILQLRQQFQQQRTVLSVATFVIPVATNNFTSTSDVIVPNFRTTNKNRVRNDQ